MADSSSCFLYCAGLLWSIVAAQLHSGDNCLGKVCDAVLEYCDSALGFCLPCEDLCYGSSDAAVRSACTSKCAAYEALTRSTTAIATSTTPESGNGTVSPVVWIVLGIVGSASISAVVLYFSIKKFRKSRQQKTTTTVTAKQLEEAIIKAETNTPLLAHKEVPTSTPTDIAIQEDQTSENSHDIIGVSQNLQPVKAPTNEQAPNILEYRNFPQDACEASGISSCYRVMDSQSQHQPEDTSVKHF